MKRVKKAEQLQIFLCEHCASVHIGLWRGGQMFAEAIPDDPGEVLNELRLAIDESQQRQASAGSKH